MIMLSRSGTFMDTMSSGSNRAGIPSCASATSNAYSEARAEEKREGREAGREGNENMLQMRHEVEKRS